MSLANKRNILIYINFERVASATLFICLIQIDIFLNKVLQNKSSLVSVVINEAIKLRAYISMRNFVMNIHHHHHPV
ncbi:hypothetical protein CRN36_01430 [Vibrio vulnificus]|nr:hypothetical protein CRN36_01430 [Vibrio vulnificus]